MKANNSPRVDNSIPIFFLFIYFKTRKGNRSKIYTRCGRVCVAEVRGTYSLASI